MAQRINHFTLLGWGSALAVLPFLLLIAYWHPLGTHAFDWASNWGEQFADQSWVEQQAYWYTTTMGRYASTALLSTASFWYSLTAARVLVLALHLGLGVAVWRLLRVLFYRLNPGTITTITLLITALYLQQMSNPYDTLYRYSGLLTYQTGLIAFLVAARLCFNERWLPALPVVLFAVGTNEISLLHCGVLLGAALFFYPPIRKSAAGWLLLGGALLAAGVALLAPGNWVRSDLYAAGGSGPVGLVGLTLATSIYTWVGWVSSTALLPLLVLLRPQLPALQFTKTRWRLLILTTVIWLPLSLAPVILATRGDSLPEGIVDWQIIPIFALLLLLSAGLPNYRLPKLVAYGLSLFVVGQLFFAGLGIDRGREKTYATPADRIEVEALAGQAWLQLLKGTPRRFDRSVRAQYDALRGCDREICLVPPLAATDDNFLYERIYDRRWKKNGDPRMCYLFGCAGSAVKTVGPN